MNSKWSEKTKSQKAAAVGGLVGLFFGCAILAFAISSYITSQSFNVANPKKHTFTMDLTG